MAEDLRSRVRCLYMYHIDKCSNSGRELTGLTVETDLGEANHHVFLIMLIKYSAVWSLLHTLELTSPLTPVNT